MAHIAWAHVAWAHGRVRASTWCTRPPARLLRRLLPWLLRLLRRLLFAEQYETKCGSGQSLPALRLAGDAVSKFSPPPRSTTTRPRLAARRLAARRPSGLLSRLLGEIVALHGQDLVCTRDYSSVVQNALIGGSECVLFAKRSEC